MLRSAIMASCMLLSASSQATVANTGQPTPYLLDMNTVPKITCGKWMGTGVYVANYLVATARHVVSGKSKCTVNGMKATVLPGKGRIDFALVVVAFKPDFRALLDCTGVHEGQQLLATGYAEDAELPVVQRLTGSETRTSEKGFSGEIIVRGSITQGMSGGPVVDINTGALVAIINANSEDGVTQTLVTPISDTSLCEKKPS